MPATTPEIFISYGWGAPQEDIVNKLYTSLTAKSYNVIRDKVNVGYKGSIRNFMQRIGAGQAVIVVLSKKYLESKNCMYEALQIKEHGDLAKRIFPIVLSDANIFEALVRLKFRRYWDDKIKELNDALRDMNDLAAVDSVMKDLNLYSDIKRFIDEFMDIVADMNVLPPETHQDSDFSQLTAALDDLFAQDAQAAPPTAGSANTIMPNQPTPAPAPPPIKKDYSTLYAEVRNFVARARLEEAIQSLRRGRPELDNDLTGFEQKLAEVKKGEMRGLLDFGEVQKVRNQVTYSILELMS